MSYTIHLYRNEVKEKFEESNDDDFFEKENNITPFTAEQKQSLKERLFAYGYELEHESGENITFGLKKEEGVEVLLTNSCLYFSSTGDGIFEISMTSSEFTDSGEFVKFDPQNGGWEEN